ncbi:MAG: sulfur relay protein DsrC [Bradyrhizobium sp.]|uniref:sulfur relay protein DsrC n=1 Tax=Bradyrhizobium sp. TaxID=376 RepID=UPI0025B89E07|nr:sulfur relay protein DsrC [Bradyrhizobium sp.]MBI5263317.1 sulfur relay protein DsrC [Bradyrhizobium sp.]
MVQISDLIISHPEVTTFGELEELVVEAARGGEVHLYFDIKPEYPDTPRKWEAQLEVAFYRAERTVK